MTFGPGENDVRKLQATGGSTFTLSLPKPWVVHHQLAPRDSLRVDWRPSGALRITPLNEASNPERHVRLHQSKLPENSLHDHLMGAYISGADVIRVGFEEGDGATVSRMIRRFLRSTRGFEIIHEESGWTELRCLLNAGDMPLHASLNRMYLQVSSLVRDIVEVLEGADLGYIADAEERESEVDALLYLVERQVRILFESHAVASRLNLSRTHALEYANLARSLERMMDHVNNMAHFLNQHPDALGFLRTSPPVNALPAWQSGLKELMINIRTRDSSRIEAARQQLKTLQQELKAYERTLQQGTGEGLETASLLGFSESVRRLCAYSRDVGEILLNMKLASDMFDVMA